MLWFNNPLVNLSALHPLFYQVLLESTGVIGRQLKMEALLGGVPELAKTLDAGAEGAHHAAVAITTTDLVSKSAALEVRLSKTRFPLT